MQAIQTLAKQLSDAFETKTRASGESFVSLKAGSPDWMTDVCQAAHDGMFPDDWRYRFIEEAADVIAECEGDRDDIEDEAHEFADSVSVYNSDLINWLASNGARPNYVDEAHDGVDRGDLINQIMLGQYQERYEVFNSLLTALDEEADSQSEEDEAA